MARKKAAKKKIEIVFDPLKRKEFLTGFRKRKNERRKRAKEELERNIKEEHKRIKQEIKDGLKHMKKTFEPLRELTEADKANEEEYEDDDVKVKIVELSTNELAAQRNLLGENRATDSEESAEEQEESELSEEDNTNRIPGMDFDVNAKKRIRRTLQGSDAEEAVDRSLADVKSIKSNADGPKSKKELNRLMKNKTLKKLKQSKVFKQKERFEKKANQKKARRDKNNTLKSLPKNQRMKKKFEPSRYRKGRLINKKQMRKKQRS